MSIRAAFGSPGPALVIAAAILGAGISMPASGDDITGLFEQAVEDTWKEYSARVNAGDADAWIALWDDNGIQMPPGAPANIGKSAILQSITAAFEAYDYRDFVINNEEVEVLGNFGFARGTYSTVLLPTGGGEPIPFSGKYLTIFKQQEDGTWKIYRDAFNSDAAPG